MALPETRAELKNAVLSSPGDNEYTLITEIGAGSFGHVWKAKDHTNADQCAIKIEPSSLAIRPLKHEVRVYRKLQGCKGIPQLREYFETATDTIMVMDLLGTSLSSLFEFKQQKFSLYTIALLAIQMIQILEEIHERGYVHRDIKPANIVFDAASNTELFLIDLGMAKSYIDPQTGQHRPLEEGKSLNGTARYASINAHEGRGQSRRDDLESLGYVLTFLSTGSLLWQGLHSKDPTARNEAIYKMKKETPVEQFCSGFPAAAALKIHIEYSRSLQYTERPNYDYLKQLYLDTLIRYEVDAVQGHWDWDEKQKSKNVMAGDPRSFKPEDTENVGTAQVTRSNVPSPAAVELPAAPTRSVPHKQEPELTTQDPEPTKESTVAPGQSHPASCAPHASGYVIVKWDGDHREVLLDPEAHCVRSFKEHLSSMFDDIPPLVAFRLYFAGEELKEDQLALSALHVADRAVFTLQSEPGLCVTLTRPGWLTPWHARIWPQESLESVLQRVAAKERVEISSCWHWKYNGGPVEVEEPLSSLGVLDGGAFVADDSIYASELPTCWVGMSTWGPWCGNLTPLSHDAYERPFQCICVCCIFPIYCMRRIEYRRIFDDSNSKFKSTQGDDTEEVVSTNRMQLISAQGARATYVRVPCVNGSILHCCCSPTTHLQGTTTTATATI